ncbi:AI-2E family transporter [Balneolaceae bacterium YR4-1]|uniref:AI-2E family transporter n=1 Tax=Halalkalibaculum roseum TaxID=2709311 RepID=A0A6M1T5D4_9BACT|nr:AI-2E family transporter [Halalkalibaculum roseum]NGP77205.1 AI-2E family transporter [Halalkalibaculum roseum]
MRNITLEKVVRFIVGFAGLTLVSLLLYNYGTLVGYAIIAIILTYILDPIVSKMQAGGLNRTLAITLTLSTLILLLVWISTNIIPIVANQMVELAGQLNIQNIQNIASQIENRLTQEFTFLPEGFLRDNLTQVVENLLDVGQLPSALSNIIGIFTNLFAAFLVIPFATFFFLKDGSKIRRDILKLVPNKYFETALSLIDKIETRLGVYFRSVLLQSILVAFSSWLALTIVGLENALSVGIAVGLANTIPYFGPIIGYILSIIVSIIEIGDFSLVLPCIIAILFVQLLDNVVFQPLIFSRSADIHPVAILFIIMIGAETAGILGMLIAIPIATTIKITINQVSWSLNNYYVFRTSDTRTS